MSVPPLREKTEATTRCGSSGQTWKLEELRFFFVTEQDSGRGCPKKSYRDAPFCGNSEFTDPRNTKKAYLHTRIRNIRNITWKPLTPSGERAQKLDFRRYDAVTEPSNRPNCLVGWSFKLSWAHVLLIRNVDILKIA